MSEQLRKAVDQAGPDGVTRARQMLLLSATDADALGSAAGVVYRALAEDLTAPATTYRGALVEATLAVDDVHSGMVDAIVEDFLGAFEDDPSNVLAFALARELRAASMLGRAELAALRNELNDHGTGPESHDVG